MKENVGDVCLHQWRMQDGVGVKPSRLRNGKIVAVKALCLATPFPKI